jgi:indolepyruvate ferredoxin oxidoreductase
MQSASARGGFPPDALVWHVEIAEVEELIAGLTPANHALAVEIAQIPEHIRGYGHVKEAHLATARTRWSELMAAWRMPKAERGAA